MIKIERYRAKRNTDGKVMEGYVVKTNCYDTAFIATGNILPVDGKGIYLEAFQVVPSTIERVEDGCEYCTIEECRNPSGRIFYKQFPHNTDCLTTLDDAHLQLAYDTKSGWVLHFEDDYGDRMFDIKTNSCPNCGKLLKGD